MIEEIAMDENNTRHIIFVESVILLRFWNMINPYEINICFKCKNLFQVFREYYTEDHQLMKSFSYVLLPQRYQQRTILHYQTNFRILSKKDVPKKPWFIWSFLRCSLCFKERMSVENAAKRFSKVVYMSLLFQRLEWKKKGGWWDNPRPGFKKN